MRIAADFLTDAREKQVLEALFSCQADQGFPLRITYKPLTGVHRR